MSLDLLAMGEINQLMRDKEESKVVKEEKEDY